MWSIVQIWTILRTIQCKIKQKYGVILKQFVERGMNNFAFQNRALQRDRVLERRVLEREYCIYFMEVYPSNFVLLNFGKYFRKICLKNKHTESTKNLTRYSVTYLKMVLLTSLILRKFSKITRIFFKKSLEIPKNRPKILKFFSNLTMSGGQFSNR